MTAKIMAPTAPVVSTPEAPVVPAVVPVVPPVVEAAVVPPVVPAEAPPAAPEQPPVAPVAPQAEGTLTLAIEQPTARPRCFYVVSQWHILPGEEDGFIVATHNQTNDKYEGPIADFNEMMKGN